MMFSPPRIWEDMLSSIMVRVGEAGWLKRKAFAWGQAVGDRYAETKLKGEKAGPRDGGQAPAGRLGGAAPGAGPARPDPHPALLHRRRAARPRRLPLLPLHRREPEADLRPDRDLRHRRHAHRRRHQVRHRRQALPGHRDQDRRERRDPAPVEGRLPRLLRQRGGHRRGHRRRRLAPHRRRRLPRRARPPGGDRPGQGRHGDARRHPLQPRLHREQAQVLALRGRVGGLLAGGVAGDHRHPHHRAVDGRGLGRAPPARLHHLHRPGRQARGQRAAGRRGGPGQRGPAGERPGAALRAAPQAVRPRRRRDHPHPQGPPPGHQRALRRHHRRAGGQAPPRWRSRAS